MPSVVAKHLTDTAWEWFAVARPGSSKQLREGSRALQEQRMHSNLRPRAKHQPQRLLGGSRARAIGSPRHWRRLLFSMARGWRSRSWCASSPANCAESLRSGAAPGEARGAARGLLLQRRPMGFGKPELSYCVEPQAHKPEPLPTSAPHADRCNDDALRALVA
jgi:hypothetical protein